jgi:tetratricopeptide (TPR) repeat protein
VICVHAHGDLDKRINLVSEEIKKTPDSAFLYYKRSQLYYQHSEFKKSLNDLKKSDKLGFDNDEKYFLYAKNYFKLNKYNLSLKHVRKILQNQPNHVKALQLVGKIYYAKRKFEKSAIAFENVIVNANKTLPENYIDASNSWYALKTETGILRAQQLLLKGIMKLGDNVVLYQTLISNAIDQKDYSFAIEYQKKVIEFSPRKERAYLKLAELQILKKDYLEAKLSLRNARNNYLKLPQRIKESNFMREFYSNIELTETRLKTINY